ncbi:MAG: sugar phosphate isomerase/epimerase [Ferruginibacter sp.]|nr:sugar phosphate isomerase/epimerase [Cytophagales bacterium]
MAGHTKRREVLKTVLLSPLLATSAVASSAPPARPPDPGEKPGGVKLKLSLNAYSFNDPLRKGTVTLNTLLDFCAANGFDAVDLTAYYFPGYPRVPADEYTYALKRQAHRLGLAVSGTGVRNDFTDPDANKRKADVALVKNWIEGAAKLGAPVIRIFSGTQSPAGYGRDQVLAWMVDNIRECVAYGKQHGVVVAIQNHHDFIKTADQAQKIVEMVDSDWFGLVLDIGSYQGGDPYQQIAQTARYAVNWQLKENVFVNGVEQKTDLDKVLRLIQSSGYRGYVPIETLGAGDPTKKVPLFLAEVRKALERNDGGN